MITVNDLLGRFWEIPTVVLPLGISFFTFTQTAYLIDAYRGETKRYSFIDYLLFVTIFPHLIAGPIINHRDMLPQFSNKALMKIDYGNIAMGLSLFSIGLFKKVVVADKLANVADPIFYNTVGVNFTDAWLGALGYSLQLYFDFSAYSEMAIGLGLLFNMHLPQNFNSPYQATSIIDFWRRWHMTLGAWVKSYLYIPMGGNRVSFGRKLFNLFIVMTLVGLWHGAGWTFVVWGMLHGVYLMANNVWRKLGHSMNNVGGHLFTLLAVICAWVIFRADTLGDAVNMFCGMADISSFALSHLGNLSAIKVMGALCIVSVINNPVVLMKSFKPNYRWLIATVGMFIYCIWELNDYSYFLYFQF